MAPLDVDEGACADRVGVADEQPHGEGRAVPMRAADEFAIEGGKVERHSDQRKAQRWSRSTREWLGGLPIRQTPD
jgi:hypothetical protein